MICRTKTFPSGIRDKAAELVYLIKSRFITTEGFLARNYPTKERTLFDNFDDIVPFFLFFDEADFLLSQINLIHKSNHNFMTLCADGNVLITRNIDEWFGGLFALWKATHDHKTFILLENSIRFVDENLLKDNYLAPAYDLYRGTITSFYEPWSSGLLETLCEMREEFPKLFEKAQNVLRLWLKDEYFRKYGLLPYRMFSSNFKRNAQRIFLSRNCPNMSFNKFPQFHPSKGLYGFLSYQRNLLKFSLSNGWYSQMMKSNSTCAFTMLEYYNATGDKFWYDSLSNWIENAKVNFVKNNKVYMKYFPKTGLRFDAEARAAFIFSDVICDSAFLLSPFRKYLPWAKSILDYQWENRLDNGMVPFSDEGCFAHIDDQVDLAISFRRFGELTHDNEYINRSRTLINDMIATHYTPEGYLTYSGEIQGNVIDPKYNALVLKGMINLITLDEPLYSRYHSLFKDR